MGDVTEANIERVLSRVESLGPKLDQCDADEKKILTVSFISFSFSLKILLSNILTKFVENSILRSFSPYLLLEIVVDFKIKAK